MAVSKFEQVLRFAVKQNASDIHFSSGIPPVVRIVGELKRVEMPPITKAELQQFIYPYLREDQKRDLEQNHEVDLAISMPGVSRYRVN
ncbi:type IV pili twitching motility protein PilT, partial [candidate division KSB1 bacterium]